ncbi:MAG: HPF/RaiA family ribosome-associated protein [Planctomycetota bacterium]|nr:HPF/RaiA family ribosome-associated protein [Planctomycetota bacterium]
MIIEVSLLSKEYRADLRTFVEEKVAGLAKFNDRLSSIRANLDQQHLDHTVELVAKVDGVDPMVVEQTGENPRAAVDIAVERMGRTIRKQREKAMDTRRR